MKKTVFIQNIPHYPTAWGDAVASWNLASFFKGMGSWYAKAYQQKLKFWSKQSFNIILDSSPTSPSELVLRHYMMSQNVHDLHKVINLNDAFKYLDENPARRTCAFGVFFKPDQKDFSTEFIINNSAWFTREPHDLVVEDEELANVYTQHKFIRLGETTPVTSEDNIGSIVWFFLYRAIDLPIYYIIPNPDMLGVAFNFNDIKGEDIRYHVTEPHFGTVGDLIFRPQYSKNVVQMTPEKIVAGETFHIDPFRGGVFEWGFKEQVPKVPIKIYSNLQYTRDKETNRIYFKFNEGQQQGYINLRWNSNALMDFSQSSHSFDNLQNKCNITLDTYRNDRYKYQEEK